MPIVKRIVCLANSCKLKGRCVAGCCQLITAVIRRDKGSGA